MYLCIAALASIGLISHIVVATCSYIDVTQWLYSGKHRILDLGPGPKNSHLKPTIKSAIPTGRRVVDCDSCCTDCILRGCKVSILPDPPGTINLCVIFWRSEEVSAWVHHRWCNSL
jgi:hypothetical protein